MAVFSIAIGFSSTGFSADNIIYGTGVGKDPIAAGTYQRDDFWNIVAVAVDFTIPGGQSAPYDAYVPYQIPGGFLGGASPAYGYNNGYTVGAETYYWITPGTNANYAPFPGTWSFIAAQQFNVTESNTYEFNFYGNGDNTMAFFVDGTVSGVATNTPTITGGTQIGPTQGDNLNALFLYTGSRYLAAGIHTAYAVVIDTGYDTGAIITNSTFSAVPEPSSLLLLGVAAVGGYLIRRKKA